MPLNQFITYVQANSQHNSFYHFTDRSNLPLIHKHGGLLPMAALKAAGITTTPGGNEWSIDADARFGMDAYVHLCFTRGHPMAHIAANDGRIKDLVWLRVHPHAIALPGVRITLDVSNKSGVTVHDAAAAISLLDGPIIYTRTDWKNPENKARLDAADKFEILVPGLLPLNYIINPNG